MMMRCRSVRGGIYIKSHLYEAKRKKADPKVTMGNALRWKLGCIDGWIAAILWMWW